MPQIEFNDQAIRALTTTRKPSTRTDYFDRDHSAFGVRVSPTGAASWFYIYRADGGKQRRWTIGQYPNVKLADARTAMKAATGKRSVAEAIGESYDPQEAKQQRRDAKAFGEMATNYLDTYAAKKKRGDYDRWMVDTILMPRWKNKALSAIDTKAVGSVMRELSDPKGRNAPGTARAVRRVVSKMFNWARSNGYDITSNPVQGTDAPKVESGEKRFLDDAEIAKLLATLDAEWRAEHKLLATWLALILLTAQRPGEVVSMRWASLSIFHPGHDRDVTGWWTMGQTKNGDPVMAALSRQAVRWLRRLHDWSVAEHARVERNMKGRREARPMSEFVFPSRGKRGQHYVDAHMGETSMTHSVDRVRAHMAGVSVDKLTQSREADRVPRLANWTPHNLRRTARTLMARKKVPKSIAEKVLNHTDPSVDSIYDRFDYQDERMQAIQAVGDAVAALAKDHAIIGRRAA